MQRLLLLLLLHFSANIICVQSEHIPVYEWQYLIENPHLVDKTAPFVVRNGPSKRWPLSNFNNLLKHLAHIFQDYGNSSYQMQTSNCLCFENDTDLCTDYVNKYTYFSQSNQKMYGKRNESFWYQYEVNYNENHQYDPCIHQIKQWDPILNIMNRIQTYNKQQYTITSNNISSLAFSFKIMDQDTRTKQLYIDDLSMKCLELISLEAYFDLFKLKNKLHDIASIHLWFGTNNYRTRLHFDANENLFFVLNGFKTFLLSPPSLNSFNLFPFLHESERQTSHITKKGIQVNVEAGDALWLPSFWYHEVINGDISSMSYALNLWILNKELTQDLIDEIEHFEFPKDIERIFRKGFKERNFYQIIYFINELETEFWERISDDDTTHLYNGLIMSYFGKIYPILFEIQRYHLFIGDNMKVIDNLEWLYWFADFSSIFEANNDKKSKALVKLFNERRHTLICKQESDRFDDVIDDIMDLLMDVKELKDENVAQIALAMLIENICFVATEDTQFMPLIAALYFL